MKATIVSRPQPRYDFIVRRNHVQYYVRVFIWTDTGAWYEVEISETGVWGGEVGHEGKDKAIRSDIEKYLRENWNRLTKA